MNNFLPSDYKEQDSSNYMKFKDGDNRFRVLSSAVVGTENWSGNKPVRWHLSDQEPNKEWDANKDGTPRRSKRFWAFVVWNYDANKIQILEITQITIQRVIMSLTQNKKWGSPFDYDITITRTGEGFETEYTVTPDPKEPVDKEIVEAYKNSNIDLEQLFTGGDPFSNKKEDVNPDEIDI